MFGFELPELRDMNFCLSLLETLFSFIIIDFYYGKPYDLN